MKRCQRQTVRTAQRLPKSLTACLRRAINGSDLCAGCAPKPLPREEVLRQAFDPLGDYVEAEIERARRTKEYARECRGPEAPGGETPSDPEGCA